MDIGHINRHPFHGLVLSHDFALQTWLSHNVEWALFVSPISEFVTKMPPKAAAQKKSKRVVDSESEEGSDQGSELESGEQRSFYEILGVDKTANAAAIKKAYHKLALLSHPDKNKDDPAATANFQQLQKVPASACVFSSAASACSF